MENNGGETTNRRTMLEITKQFYEELYTSPLEQTEDDTSQATNHKVLNKGFEDLPIITIGEVRNTFDTVKFPAILAS